MICPILLRDSLSQSVPYVFNLNCHFPQKTHLSKIFFQKISLKTAKVQVVNHLNVSFCLVSNLFILINLLEEAPNNSAVELNLKF